MPLSHVLRAFSVDSLSIKFIPSYVNFLPTHIVHGVLTASILEWFAIPSSSGPGFVRTLYYDLSILDGSAPPASLSCTSPFHHSKAVIHEEGSYTRSTVTGSSL